jgi:hypothetical protein
MQLSKKDWLATISTWSIHRCQPPFRSPVASLNLAEIEKTFTEVLLTD